MKVISELIDYFVRRRALSPQQLEQLSQLGFLDRPDAPEAPLPNPSEEAEPEEHPEPPPVRAKKRSRPPRSGLTEDALSARLAASKADWSEELAGLVSLAQSLSPATLETAPLILRNAEDDDLEAALRRALDTRTPPFNRLWDAISMRGYHDIVEPGTGQGPVANSWLAILRSDAHEERGKHAWLLRMPEIRWVYNLIRAQRRVVEVLGSIREQDPEMILRALARDYSPQALLTLLILYNAGRRRPSLRGKLTGHTGAIRALAITADDKFVVSGGADGTMRIWSLDSRSEVSQVQTGAPVNCVAISPNGRLAVAGNDAGVITVRSLSGPSDIPAWATGPGPIHALAFSPDGEILASAGRNGFIHLWDPIFQDLLADLGGHEKPVVATAVAPATDLLATSDGKRIHLWEGPLHRCLAELPAGAPIHRLAFDAEGRRLVWCSPGMLVVLSIPSGASLALREESYLGTCVAFAPDGQTIAAGGNTRVRLLDHSLVPSGADLSCPYPVVSVDFTRNGDALVGVCDNGKAFLWNRPGPGVEATWFPAANTRRLTVRYSQPHDLLAVADSVISIRVWKILDGSPNFLRRLSGHRPGPAIALAIHPGGRFLCSANREGEILAWDLETGQRSLLSKDTSLPVSSLEFRDDDHLIVGGEGPGGTGVLRMLKFPDGHEVRRQSGNPDSVLALAFHPHEPTLLSGGDGSTVSLWDVSRRSHAGWIPITWSPVRGLLVLPAEGLLAVAHHQNVRTFHLADGSLEQYFGWHNDPVSAVASLREGVLASGDATGVVRLWNPGTAERLGSLGGHRGPVFAVVTAHDGRTVITSGEDSQIRIHDADAAIMTPAESIPGYEGLHHIGWREWQTAWEQALILDADRVPAYLAVLAGWRDALFDSQRFRSLGLHLGSMPFFRPAEWGFQKRWETKNTTD